MMAVGGFMGISQGTFVVLGGRLDTVKDLGESTRKTPSPI
jgi:hypothetical protein